MSVVVKRNEVELTFVDKKIKRGKDEGVVYPAPEVSTDPEKMNRLIQFLGTDILAAILEAWLNRQCQNWLAETCEQDSEGNPIYDTANLEQFVEFAQTMSARGASIRELTERIMDITTEQIPAIIETEDMDDPATLVKLKKLTDEVKSIKQAINSKRRKTDEDKAAEAAAKQVVNA